MRTLNAGGRERDGSRGSAADVWGTEGESSVPLPGGAFREREAAWVCPHLPSMVTFRPRVGAREGGVV